MTTHLFEYSEPQSDPAPADTFALHVPKAIQSKSELLRALAKAGQFPDYFGGNWDALLDCLRDFGWIQQRRIAIIHGDLPLQHDAAECRTYLAILGEAVADWVRVQPSADFTSPSTASQPHELRVLFPLNQRRRISALLNS